jgi:hypothetical protein
MAKVRCLLGLATMVAHGLNTLHELETSNCTNFQWIAAAGRRSDMPVMAHTHVSLPKYQEA